MAQPHEMATLVQRGSTRTSAHTRGAATGGRHIGAAPPGPDRRRWARGPKPAANGLGDGPRRRWKGVWSPYPPDSPCWALAGGTGAEGQAGPRPPPRPRPPGGHPRPNPANGPPDRADPRPNRDKRYLHPQLVIFSCQCSSP